MLNSLPEIAKFSPIGRCIYCGALNNLSREHIVPESIGGRLVLPAASCDACADITKRFEQRVARNMYWPLRLSLGMGKKNRKRERPTHWEVEVSGEGTEQVKVRVEIAKLPKVYVVVEMPPAGIILGEPPRDTNPELKLHLKGNEAELQRFTSQMNAGKIQTEHLFDWNAFNRMLAKIAHGITVGYLGFDGLNRLLPPLILGPAAHFPYLIGGISNPSDALTPPCDIALRMLDIRGLQYITVLISLLGSRTPTYEVVSAQITDLGSVEKRFNMRMEGSQ